MAAENDNAESHEDRAGFNQEQYDVLTRCSAKQDMTEWNTYRAEHPEIGIQLQNAGLRVADLKSANLRGANLKSADLTRANLRGADLKSADLTRANLRGADLKSADLAGASLFGANLTGANLTGADLEGASLFVANVTRADLRGANLQNADLRGTDLTVTHPPPKLTETVEMVINLADDITYEEVTGLLTAIKGLSLDLAGILPSLKEIQIGEHTDEYTAAWRKD